MYVRDLQPGMIDDLRQTPGVVDVRQRVATLEETFVACTSGDMATEGMTSEKIESNSDSFDAFESSESRKEATQ